MKNMRKLGTMLGTNYVFNQHFSLLFLKLILHIFSQYIFIECLVCARHLLERERL